MAKELRTLGWDYLMFIAFVLFTVFAPLWSRIFGKKKERSKADYVFATGGISIFAIMLSIARGTLGVRSVLGYPSELYYRGSAMWEVIYGMMSAYPIVCFVFVPVYFNLGITSVYQYLDLRFKSRLVRCLAAGTYIVRQICNLGVTVYTPSVALSTVIGIPYWASIISISLICIFFTLLGGLKAAINADVIQTVTVILVTVVVIIKGLIEAGGPARVYEINRDNGRLSFFNFTGDMTVRVDTLSAWLGQLFMSLSQFGCQQNFMQRYISLKSLSAVKQAMMANIPIIFFFFSLSWISGMVIYAAYIDCDPLADGFIRKPDEIMPFFVEDQLAFIPGFLGIFMAMLFNGALCMMVSNLNSLSTVICEDFLSFIPAFKSFNDKQQLTVIKLVCIVCGLLVMGIAFGVGMLSGVIESSMLAFSATSGPLLGCFVLAMLVPFANWKGTATGMIASCMSVIWIVFGNATIDTQNSNEWLPTSTEGCNNHSFSSSIHRPVNWIVDFTPELNVTHADFITETAAPERTPLEYFYSISYMYYSLLGALVCISVGCIVSYLTLSDDDQYDGALLHPLILKWCQRSNSKKSYYLKNCVEVTAPTKNAQVNAAFDAQTEPHMLKEKKLCEKSSVKPIQLVLDTNNTKPTQINSAISTITDSVRSDMDANEHTMGSYVKKTENGQHD